MDIKKAPFTPQALMTRPPSAGPTMLEMFCANPFSTMAFMSVCFGTTVGMVDIRTGFPKASDTPSSRASTIVSA